MISQTGSEILAMLPAYYTGENIDALLDTQGAKFDELWALIYFVIDQIFVITASDMGLTRWERDLGLTPGANDTEGERQARILSHLRGYGTTTFNVIRSMVWAFTGVEPQLPKDMFVAGQSVAGDQAWGTDYATGDIYMIKMFTAGYSRAGDQAWGMDRTYSLVITIRQPFRAGYSAAGASTYSIEASYDYLALSNLIDTTELAKVLSVVIPAHIQLIIN